MANVIRELWLLSTDRDISDEDAEKRAVQWLKLFKDSLFNERYRYKIEIVTELHQTHGRPILAPELFQVSERVEAGYIWQGQDNWVPLHQIQNSIWNNDPEFKDKLINQIPEEEKQAILTEINRRIYGGR